MEAQSNYGMALTPVARREEDRTLYVPLSDGKIASIPYPITKEAWDILMDSLRLWMSMMVLEEPLRSLNPVPPLNNISNESFKREKELQDTIERAKQNVKERVKPGRDFDFEDPAKRPE
jgi:hypothetical protein